MKECKKRFNVFEKIESVKRILESTVPGGDSSSVCGLKFNLSWEHN